MFAQFFGSYLLNEGLVTPVQLAKALEDKKNTKTRLGVLAINAGYMTAGQVELVHQVQATVDKRIGDIAVEMGFMTSEQIDELLSQQPLDYLVLGQTLVNDGILTNLQFENALSEYKIKNSLSDEDLKNDKTDKLEDLIEDYYKLELGENARAYTSYLSLLFKNLVRFIGDDFTPLGAEKITNIECVNLVSQDINANSIITTGISCFDKEYIKLAERFSEEKLDKVDEFVNATVGEFLNLNNGLFIVNQSNEFGIEMTLSPQQFAFNTVKTFGTSAVSIPVAYSFGTVYFIIANL